MDKTKASTKIISTCPALINNKKKYHYGYQFRLAVRVMEIPEPPTGTLKRLLWIMRRDNEK